ncbi:NACHT domain-containing protein [Peribacillus frigoritolerans]|uniref:NACHT domain-containing protein n=1 Tax=Peribacillus frigoritolerans TaxID=450367 RepID=UPI0035184C56
MVVENKIRFQKEGLNKIKEEGNIAAIIFVHGLAGHSIKTWSKKNCDSLPEIMAKDKTFKNYDIYSFGYKTGFMFKQHHYHQISKLLASELKARINYNELYFIGHSMGGLIIQKLIIDQVERNNLDFISKVKGIIYLAVPFYGAVGGTASASAFAFLPPIIGEYLLSQQVRVLRIFGSELEEQSNKWFNYSKGILNHVRQKNIYGLSDKTVKTFSANPAYIHDSDVVEETHRSICKINNDSTVYQFISQFFEYAHLIRIGEREQNLEELELKKYQLWLKRKVSEFIVPGVGTPLNIEDAWASIHVWEMTGEKSYETLESKIKKYHEWERLSEYQWTRQNAQDMVLLGKHIVLIGGPGSGKSTLAKRTVHQLVNQKDIVLYTKISRVSKEITQGKSFEKALLESSIEGYTGDKVLLKSILAQPKVLILDGLDESGPNRKEISESIKEWVDARPEVQVIITTRPIGYEPAYFHNYNHVEVLPLSKEEIYNYAPKLINVLVSQHSTSEKVIGNFKEQLEKNRTASVAARSPLLLNFIIQLYVSGESFGSVRADLYSKILNEWMSQIDRGEYINVSPQIALSTLEWIGWTLQEAQDTNWGRSKSNIIDGLGNYLSEQKNINILEGRESAELYLRYWTEKGVLEHLKVDHEDAYTFIHQTLCEYNAARFFTSMDQSKQIDTLLKIYRKPIWRETILLAGGEGSAQLIVEQLLNLQQEKHDVFNDIVLAAAVLAETNSCHDSLIKRVLDRLTATICSPIPLLAYEAGEACKGFAMQKPEWVSELASPLLKHKQQWTSIVALYLSLSSNESIFDTESYIKWLKETEKQKPKFIPFKEADHRLTFNYFWNESIVLGIKQLLNKKLSRDELINIAEALSDTSLSVKATIEFQKAINDEDIDCINQITDILDKKFSSFKNSNDFMESENRMKQGELAFLETILNAIDKDINHDSEQTMTLANLARLYDVMGVGEKIAGDLYFLKGETSSPSVKVVIKGMIGVWGINEEKLYKEIQWVLANDIERLIYGRLPDIPTIEPNWDNYSVLDLNVKYLVNALSHKSDTISHSAILLLVNCVNNEEVLSLIQKEVESNYRIRYKNISLILRFLDAEGRMDFILERLQGENSFGFVDLYSCINDIPLMEKDKKKIQRILISGITNEDNKIAAAAAETMSKLKFDYNEQEIWEIISIWDEEGVMCNRCRISVKGSSCPKCSVVPPNPINYLLIVLINLGSLNREKWYYYANHTRQDVRRSAIKGLSLCLTTELSMLINLIDDIKREKKPAYLLESVFMVDAKVLLGIKSEILTLISSTSSEVRKRFLEEITNAKWLPREEAYILTELALEDENSEVKNQTIKTIRSLKK